MADKKTALVTGASTGFGRLTAERLADEGYRVFGTMRETHGRNAANKRDLEARGVTVVEMDVTDDASVERAAATVLADAGHLDVLINNAGTAHMGALEGFSAASVTQQLATNVVGPVRVSRAFLPGMRARKSGLVVFVSSVVGRVVIPFNAVYTSSKWALEALAESLSYEVRPYGIDVAIVQPGAYATNIFNVVVGPDEPERLASYDPSAAKMMEGIGAALTASAGDPIEVADAIVGIVNAAPGTRPLRTTVPTQGAATAINAAVEPLQRGVLEQFGLGALLAPFPAAV